MRISDWSSDVCSSDLLFEGREEDFAQRALGDRRGADIGAAFGLTVTGHVLERREDMAGADLCRPPLPLQPLHRRNAEFADEEGVLAERLLDAAPARVARDVDDGREIGRAHVCTPDNNAN